jgi:hypothetical protein
MVQGDGSVYPVLPISLSIIAGCYIFSFIIAKISDFVYDIYLIRYCNLPEKDLIVARVRNDIQRMKNILKTDKIEIFNPNEAKKRLTIISKLVNERINSKENRPFLDEIREKERVKNNSETSGKENEKNKKESILSIFFQQKDKLNDETNSNADKINTVSSPSLIKNNLKNENIVEDSTTQNDNIDV